MKQNNTYSVTAVFTAACIGMCFFGVSMITLGSVLPSLSRALALTPGQTIDLTTLLPMGLLAGSVVFGPVVDRFGHKLMLIGNCLLVLAGLLGMAFATDVTVLKVAIAAIGFGGGVLNGETNALVSDIYEGQTRNSRLSFLGVFYGLGALTIPLLLGTLERQYSYTTLLAGIGCIMAAGIIICIPMRFPAPKQPQGFPLRDAARIITNPVLLLLSFILFFQSGVEGVTNNWTASFLVGTGFDNSQAQFALTAMLIGLTGARILQSYLFTRVEGGKVLMVSLGIAAAGFVALLTLPSTGAVMAAMVLVGAGLASTFPVVLGVLGERFAALSGTAFSVALVIALTGQTTLNFVTGLVARDAGVAYFPWITIASVAVMALLFVSYRAGARKMK